MSLNISVETQDFASLRHSIANNMRDQQRIVF